MHNEEKKWIWVTWEAPGYPKRPFLVVFSPFLGFLRALNGAKLRFQVIYHLPIEVYQLPNAFVDFGFRGVLSRSWPTVQWSRDA